MYLSLLGDFWRQLVALDLLGVSEDNSRINTKSGMLPLYSYTILCVSLSHKIWTTYTSIWNSLILFLKRWTMDLWLAARSLHNVQSDSFIFPTAGGQLQDNFKAATHESTVHANVVLKMPMLYFLTLLYVFELNCSSQLYREDRSLFHQFYNSYGV